MKLISDETYARIAHMTWNELANEYEKLNAKYYDLILSVETKHPDETRHETALRYIQERERGSTEPAQKETP